MDPKPIFTLLSQKGIDNVNLDMLPEDQKKEIYEKYGDFFTDEKGKSASYIAIKAYARAKNINKVRERLINEIDYAARDKRFKYCYYCSLLLDNNEMAAYFEQFIQDCPDNSIDYSDFYFGIKKELENIQNGPSKIQ